MTEKWKNDSIYHLYSEADKGNGYYFQLRNFRVDSSVLTSVHLAYLKGTAGDRVRKALTVPLSRDGFRIAVRGSASGTGDPKRNETLARQRAHVLAQYLRNDVGITSPIDEMLYIWNDPGNKAMKENAALYSKYHIKATSANLTNGPIKPEAGAEDSNERMVECICGFSPGFDRFSHFG